MTQQSRPCAHRSCRCFRAGVVRAHLTILLRDDKKPTQQNVKDLQNMQLLKRSNRFRTHCAFLPASAHRMRKQYFVQDEFRERPKAETETDANNPMAQMQDPTQMMGMMKQNFAAIIPNMLLLGWVSYFFSGFVLVKLPFPLTERFRS